MDEKTLGNNIVAYRNKRNMTQEKLAEQIEISNVFLSQIENGVRRPSLSTLIRLSQVLGASVDRLLGLDGPEQDSRYHSILALLHNMTEEELALIEDACRAICRHLENNQVISESKPE